MELDLAVMVECLRHHWPIYDPSRPNRYRGGPFDMDADAMARSIKEEYDRAVHHADDKPLPDGPPAECPTGKHSWYVHEHNTPCYGFDGEIYLPPGTKHCRDCFKAWGARRRAVPA